MNTQKWLRPLRRILALVVLAAFIIIFSDVRGKLPSAWVGVFTSIQLVPSLLKMILPLSLLSGLFLVLIALTLLSGRVYCSVLCPLGISMDVANRMLRWMPFLRRKARFKKAANYVRYPLLILLLLSLFSTGLFALNWLDPYANFSRMATYLYQPVYIAGSNVLAHAAAHWGVAALQAVPVNPFIPLAFFSALSFLLLVFTLMLFRDRLYCNAICPVGTFLGLLSRFSFFRVQIHKENCSQCGACQQVCKSDCINIKNLTVDTSRCVVCYNCLGACNANAIRYSAQWKISEKAVRQRDPSKRAFLKAGMLFMGAAPLLAEAKGHGANALCFWSRGVALPPGSQSLKHLKDKCIACNLCIASCPTKVLQPAFLEYGFTGMMLPKMDFQKGYCNYECTHCGAVCPTGAILALSAEEKKITQIGKAEFRPGRCIVKTEGTACGSCSEHCPTQAVHMVPYGDNLTLPEVNADICIGCGACEHACPVEDPHPAIFVVPHEVHQKAQLPKVEETTEVKNDHDDFPF